MRRLLMRLTVALVMAAIMAVTASVALAAPENQTACDKFQEDRIDGFDNRIDFLAGKFKNADGLHDHARDNLLLKTQQNLCS